MNVYVLIANDMVDGDEIIAIYTDKLKALDDLDKANIELPFQSCRISEFEVEE